MKSNWVGYLSSVILLLAGILQFIANNIILGCLFTLCAIAGVVIKIIISNKLKQKK